MFKTELYIMTSILLAAGLQSCSEPDSVTTPEEETVDYGFTVAGTKSGDSGATTYRAMLLSASGVQGTYPYINNAVPSGTYRGPETDERAWLTACKVNGATGVWEEDNHKYGLRANRGSYYLSFVSPAVAPSQYKWNETTKKYEEWGFPLKRVLQADEPVLSISSPKKINSLTGNHLEKEYVYDVPDDVVLMERRSKVTLKLKCGDDLESATVGKVSWTEVYEDCWYNLRLDSLDTFTLSADTIDVYTPAVPLVISKGDSVEVCSGFYLFSLYYAQKDEHDEYVFRTPTINLSVAQGLASLKVFQNLRPQYEYTYTITINSAYVTVSVSSRPWDEVEQSATIDETPEYPQQFDIRPWETVFASGEIN